MTTVNGKQIKLSTDKAEAHRLFHRLMAADKPPAAGPGVTVRRLLDTYLAKTAAGRGERRTYSVARRGAGAECYDGSYSPNTKML